MRFSWPYALVIAALPLAAQQPCENLAKLALPNTTITMATSVSAGSFAVPGGRAGAAPASVPAFCRVAATIAPDIKFELWMPANWNRKFMAVGNGGLAGTIRYESLLDPLRRGYATSNTDTGHAADNDGHWAQGHMQRVFDYAFRAVHAMTQADKAIIKEF